MEDIQKLQQDNAKLQERLNNAAKFFREQKAQIEALTKENEELKRTPKDEVINTEKWNTLVTEKENLNKQLNEYESKLQKLESDIDSKDKAYKVLQDTYNEVFAEKEKITKQYKEQEKFETEVINVKVPELEERLKNTEKAYKELQDKYKANDIAKGEAELREQSLHNEYIKKFEEQNIQIDTLKKKFEEEGKNAVANKVLLDKANEKIDKLNKLYDDCENEKLAAQADYDSLKEKYESLKINAEANEEVARKYEEIYEEYETLKSKESLEKELYKFNKDDINKLCDTILDFFKDNNLNKE